MMKNIILALLLVASFSFAVKPPIPPPDMGYAHGQVFLHAICSYNQLGYLLSEAQNNYWVSGGKGCVHPDMSGHSAAVFEAFYGDGSPGLVYLYQSVLWACEGGQNTDECYAAQRSFYSGAKSARDVFSAAKTAYLLSAMQAIYANSNELCKNSVRGIYEDISGAGATYRECMRRGPIIG